MMFALKSSSPIRSSLSRLMVRQISLSTPIKLGDVQLRNRNVMASMTRNRSVPKSIPSDANLDYYTQRARSAGLLMTEGTLTSHQGTEFPDAPGIWGEEHVKAWSKIVTSVHEKGSTIFIQLWHLGRIVNEDMPEQKLANKPCPGPSAIAARGGQMRLLPGTPGYSTPTPLTDPWEIVEEFRRAAVNSKKAGFDGAELHAANGYLIHQFLDNTSNKRTDMWGGSVENRARLGLESLKAIIAVFGPGRTGIKINPCGGYNDVGMRLEDTIQTFSYFVKEATKLGIAYVQLVDYVEAMDPMFDGKPRGTPHDLLKTYGPIIKDSGSKLLFNGNLTPAKANELLVSGEIDAAAFGKLWISNPDLQSRIENGAPLDKSINFKAFYIYPEGKPSAGYSDYPDASGILYGKL